MLDLCKQHVTHWGELPIHLPADRKLLSNMARCSRPVWLGGSSSRLAVSERGAPVSRDRANDPDACKARDGVVGAGERRIDMWWREQLWRDKDTESRLRGGRGRAWQQSACVSTASSERRQGHVNATAPAWHKSKLTCDASWNCAGRVTRKQTAAQISPRQNQSCGEREEETENEVGDSNGSNAQMISTRITHVYSSVLCT